MRATDSDEPSPPGCFRSVEETGTEKAIQALMLRSIGRALNSRTGL